MYPKKACIDAVSWSETERKSGVKQIGLVGARAVCGSDSRSAVSRGNQTGLCGWFIISSVDSAAESTGDMAIYCESPLTSFSMATTREARQLEKLKIHCLAVLL